MAESKQHNWNGFETRRLWSETLDEAVKSRKEERKKLEPGKRGIRLHNVHFVGLALYTRVEADGSMRGKSTFEILAQDTTLSVATIKKAVKVLNELGIVLTVRLGRTIIHQLAMKGEHARLGL